MAQPSEETKKSAASMAFGRLSKLALTGAKKTISTVGKLFTKKPDNLVDESSPPTKIMGEIYKMMKLMDLDRKLNQEAANSHIEEQGHMRDKRNKEIIKALTTPKIKKPRVVKPKKVKTQEPETTPLPPVSKTPTKQTAPTQPSTPPTQPPATPPKTTTPAPKTEAPTTAPAAPAKTTKPKTAEPAKEIAGPPKPTAAPAKKTTAPPAQTTPPPQTAAPAPTITAPVSSTAAKVGVGVAIAGGTSAAMSASMKFEVGVTNEQEALQSVGKIVNDVKGTKSYGLFGINNERRIGKKGQIISSGLDAFVKDNSQFNLPDPANSKQFDDAWIKLSKEKPKELMDAQVSHYKKYYEDPAIKSLTNIDPKISLDPGVQLYMTDRKIQFGDVMLNSALKYASNAKTPQEFLKLISEHDLTNLRNIFKNTSDSEFGTLEKGLKNRIQKRYETGVGTSIPNAQPMPNNKGGKLGAASVEGQDLKKDMAAQQEKMQAQQSINVLAQASTEPQVNLTKPKDSNPLLDKVRAG